MASLSSTILPQRHADLRNFLEPASLGCSSSRVACAPRTATSRSLIRCNAAAADATSRSLSRSTADGVKIVQRDRLPTTLTFKIVFGVLDALLSVKPIFNLMMDQGKKMMVDRGEKMGFPWTPRLAELQKNDWETEFQNVNRKDIKYPKYFFGPFHSYPEGNMSWDAALESVLASRSVHATVFSKDKKILDPDGDDKLRRSYHEIMVPMLPSTPNDILDIGCSSGLSSFKLHQEFPDAHVTGLDLSPYFLAFANYNLRELEAEKGGQKLPVKFIHGVAEDTQLPSESFDLISVSLCFHEIPGEASQQIIQEAYRLLRPGGSIGIMDVNPDCDLFKSPFLFTIFNSTEPLLKEYLMFPMIEVLEGAGFDIAIAKANTPNHLTIVGRKGVGGGTA